MTRTDNGKPDTDLAERLRAVARIMIQAILREFRLEWAAEACESLGPGGDTAAERHSADQDGNNQNVPTNQAICGPHDQGVPNGDGEGV